MRALQETLRCLVVLCCVSSLQCRVLKFVVAVSPRRLLPAFSVRANKIYRPPRCLAYVFYQREALDLAKGDAVVSLPPITR